jgi:hypothetical protein
MFNSSIFYTRDHMHLVLARAWLRISESYRLQCKVGRILVEGGCSYIQQHTSGKNRNVKHLKNHTYKQKQSYTLSMDATTRSDTPTRVAGVIKKKLMQQAQVLYHSRNGRQSMYMCTGGMLWRRVKSGRFMSKEKEMEKDVITTSPGPTENTLRPIGCKRWTFGGCWGFINLKPDSARAFFL